MDLLSKEPWELSNSNFRVPVTAVSQYLPSIANEMATRLPVELTWPILTRLPVSAVLELSIVEDQCNRHIGNMLASGQLSQCILSCPGWKAVFPNVTTLLRLRELYEIIIEAYNLIYRRPFGHINRHRTSIGVKETGFNQLRRFLSMHTREHGPSHPELRNLGWILASAHFTVVRDIWRSLAFCWGSYMSDAPDLLWKDEYRKSILQVPDAWVEAFVTKQDASNMTQRKLVYMVSVDRHYRAKQGEELNVMARLMEQHPVLLKRLGDPIQQSRPNIHHITQRLSQEAYRLCNIKFAVRKSLYGFAEGDSMFNTPSLPIQPLDKAMWFFLECRNGNLPFNEDIAKTIKTVDDGLLYFNEARQDTQSRVRREALPRLVCHPYERQLFGDREDAFHREVPGAFRTFQRNVLRGTERRPFVTFAPRGTWISPRPQKGDEHTRFDVEWLEAFLRCCKYFLEHFPLIWDRVDKEAAEKFPHCSVAEERRQKKLGRHFASELVQRGAKFELLKPF